MAWKLLRISSGHLSLENGDFESDQIYEVLSEIESKLEDSPTFGGKIGATPSAAAAELLIDGVRLTLGWDIWSGVFIMALDNDGDQVIHNIISQIFL